MKTFLDYQIIINYSLHTQLRSASAELSLHTAGRYEEERRQVIKSYTKSDSAIENNMYARDIESWEGTVFRCLQKIDSNPVGKLVLGLISKQTTVWIVPSLDIVKRCYCATTKPLNYEIPKDGSYARGAGFGDTVITFNPDLGDDTLFHELVHAYRYSYKKFTDKLFYVWNGGSQTQQKVEEFFAHQMQNIYLSYNNRPLLLDYTWSKPAPTKEIYDFLASNPEMLMAIKSLLRHEYMAMLAAHSFTGAYNPFRDIKALEATYLEGSG